MRDPLKSLLQQSDLKTNAFPPSSRYHGIDIADLEAKNGNVIRYVKRRFIPQPEKFSQIREHTVRQGERVDQIANQYIADPLQFWRLCDANRVMHPDELTAKTGRRIRITLPEGIPGNNYA